MDIKDALSESNVPNNLAKRIVEESNPGTVDQADPLTCLKYGISLDKSKIMKPSDFTKEAAQTLIKANVPAAEIMRLYSIKMEQSLTHILKNFGIEIPKTNKHPWRTFPTNQAKLTPVEAVTQGVTTEHAKIMTPADLTKDDAIILLGANVSKTELLRIYGFKNYPALYHKLEKLGLHTPKNKKVEEKPEMETKKISMSAFQAFDRLGELEENIKCIEEIDEIPLTKEVQELINTAKDNYENEVEKLKAALESVSIEVA